MAAGTALALSSGSRWAGKGAFMVWLGGRDGVRLGRSAPTLS